MADSLRITGTPDKTGKIVITRALVLSDLPRTCDSVNLKSIRLAAWIIAKTVEDIGKKIVTRKSSKCRKKAFLLTLDVISSHTRKSLLRSSSSSEDKPKLLGLNLCFSLRNFVQRQITIPSLRKIS